MQPYGHYEAFDMSYEPSDHPRQPANFIPSRRVHEYLDKYAQTWGVKERIQFGTTVMRCRRAPDGVKWEVHNKRSDREVEEVIVCDKLVVATGQTSLPHMPTIPSDNFTPLTIHSRYLGTHYNYLQSPEVNTVCVYGGGKSAYDAVTAAAKRGKHVHWVIKSAQEGGGVGGCFTPEFIGEGAADAALTPATGVLQPNILATDSWGHRFFHSGRNRFGSWFIWWFWGFISRRTLGKWNYERHEQMMKLKPEVYDHR
jgi:dimethylaniline monooxygenase (N-oxide forming)